jgi:hypothetical protein
MCGQTGPGCWFSSLLAKGDGEKDIDSLIDKFINLRIY